MLEFANTVDDTLSNYDEDGMYSMSCSAHYLLSSCIPSGAWPVLIDEFVEFARPIVQSKSQ